MKIFAKWQQDRRKRLLRQVLRVDCLNAAEDVALKCAKQPFNRSGWILVVQSLQLPGETVTDKCGQRLEAASKMHYPAFVCETITLYRSLSGWWAEFNNVIARKRSPLPFGIEVIKASDNSGIISRWLCRFWCQPIGSGNIKIRRIPCVGVIHLLITAAGY
ncbi:hypothetical protein [Enterobacter hormaechei]|uniref:hypothetical protein n=1 Tax=Enterobacter hormaechei TaxID=158836 RepID=UPI002017C21D|nr:hypothetical protein [Enterobacter hormaechei]